MTNRSDAGQNRLFVSRMVPATVVDVRLDAMVPWLAAGDIGVDMEPAK